MSTTKKIIIIVLTVILLGTGAFWFLTRQTSTNGNTDTSGLSVRDFFPFGNSDKNTINNTDSSNNDNQSGNQNNISTTTGGSTTVPIAKLRKISERPVSGAIIFNKASTSIVRFVEKATGNVYEAKSDSSEVRRLTNETIPKVSRSFWLKDGSGFLVQRLDTNENIETSYVKLRMNSTSTKDSIPFETLISNLPIGIQELSVSPDSKKVFYYINNDKTSGFISNPDGTSPNLVFSNYTNEWIPQWFSGNNISITTKASGSVGSFGFILNSANKTLTKTYTNVYGASSLTSPDGKHILLGNSGGSISNFEVSSSNTSNIGVSTLPEKCVWDPADLKFVFCAVPKDIFSGNYPDDWYRGTASTNDVIQKINVVDIYTYILSNPNKEVGVNIDVSNIQSSPNGSFLIFINKNDSSLWILDAK